MQAYRGDEDDSTDIQARCGFMVSAIRAAAKKASADEGVLKIFMAPEFFYRGKRGGYVEDHLHEVALEMRKETDGWSYADWLFVFGTAIGYVEHGGANPDPTSTDHFIKHGTELRLATVDTVNSTGTLATITTDEKIAGFVERAVSAGGAWMAFQGPTTARINKATATSKRTCDLEVLPFTSTKLTTGPIDLYEFNCFVFDVTHPGNTVLRVRATQCARIPLTVGSPNWWAVQGTKMAAIRGWRNLHPGADPPRHEYELTLDRPMPDFQEPPLLAARARRRRGHERRLLQKGWPAPEPDDKVLKAAAIYKEYVSQLDFLSGDSGGVTTSTSIPPSRRTSATSCRS